MSHEEESSEDGNENDGFTLVTHDIGEMLLIKRSLHATKITYEDSHMQQIFISRCTIESNICSLITDG